MYLRKVLIKDLSYPPSMHDKLSVFHNKDWLKIYEPFINVIGIFNNNDQIIGLFYYFKNTKLGLNYIIPPPFIPFNGLIINVESKKEERKNSFLKQVHQMIHNYFIHSEKASFIRFALPPIFIDTQVFQWNKWRVKVNYTYQLNLEKSEKELFDGLSSEKRKSIRKSEKDGVLIKAENNYSIVMDLVLKTFQRQNKKINKEYLQKILLEWANSNNSFAFVAYFNEKPISATFCVYDQNTSYYLLGGYDEANAHHGSGVSCMWNSILKSKRLGLKCFDFEGSMLPQVERYFRDFGGSLVPYYVCEKKAWYVPL